MLEKIIIIIGIISTFAGCFAYVRSFIKNIIDAIKEGKEAIAYFKKINADGKITKEEQAKMIKEIEDFMIELQEVLSDALKIWKIISNNKKLKKLKQKK